MISWYFIFTIVFVLLALASFTVFWMNRPKTAKDGSTDPRYSRKKYEPVGHYAGGLFVFLALAIGIIGTQSIIQTGNAGIVRVFGVVQEETLVEGRNTVPLWATVTRQEVRGFQLDQSGDNALKMLTARGARYTMDVGVPIRLNPKAAALVESRIRNGDWKNEVIQLSRGIIRNNGLKYATLANYNARRANQPIAVLDLEGEPVLVEGEPLMQAAFESSHGDELRNEILTGINSLFCDTYTICGIDAVIIGAINIRDVQPPPAVQAEAAALEAAVISQQTETALNAVEEIRAGRRQQEGIGYGNLFSFLPEGTTLTPESAGYFLRAAADKTRADAEAYQARGITDALSEAIEKGTVNPNLIVSSGGTVPQPMFTPGARN